MAISAIFYLILYYETSSRALAAQLAVTSQEVISRLSTPHAVQWPLNLNANQMDQYFSVLKTIYTSPARFGLDPQSPNGRNLARRALVELGKFSAPASGQLSQNARLFYQNQFELVQTKAAPYDYQVDLIRSLKNANTVETTEMIVKLISPEKSAAAFALFSTMDLLSPEQPPVDLRESDQPQEKKDATSSMLGIEQKPLNDRSRASEWRKVADLALDKIKDFESTGSAKNLKDLLQQSKLLIRSFRNGDQKIPAEVLAIYQKSKHDRPILKIISGDASGSSPLTQSSHASNTQASPKISEPSLDTQHDPTALSHSNEFSISLKMFLKIILGITIGVGLLWGIRRLI